VYVLILDDNANLIIAKYQEIAKKLNEVSNYAGQIKSQQVFGDHTLKWSDEVKQEIYDKYLVAKAELATLVSELPS